MPGDYRESPGILTTRIFHAPLLSPLPGHSCNTLMTLGFACCHTGVCLKGIAGPVCLHMNKMTRQINMSDTESKLPEGILRRKTERTEVPRLA